jgi:hypothetical protein
MDFTDSEIAEYTKLIEDQFWSRRRPHLSLREKVREGQKIVGQDIELFFARPAFNRPGQYLEEPIAKIQFVRRRNGWKIYWQRADLKWHAYQPTPIVESLAEALRVIDADTNSCFFG